MDRASENQGRILVPSVRLEREFSSHIPLHSETASLGRPVNGRILQSSLSKVQHTKMQMMPILGASYDELVM